MALTSKLSRNAKGALLTAIVLCAAVPSTAVAHNGSAHGTATVGSPKLTLKRHRRHVPPAPRNRHSRHHAKPLARLSAWDATRQVDAIAYCTQNAYGAWSFGAAHPWSVMPTVSGNQSIAFRFNVYRSDGTSLGSTDWWEGEVDRYGLFHGWARGGDYLYYKFMNMRTGELYNQVGYTLYPPHGLGYRETITVFWYVNGAWSRSITFAPAWSTGASPSAYCMG